MVFKKSKSFGLLLSLLACAVLIFSGCSASRSEQSGKAGNHNVAKSASMQDQAAQSTPPASAAPTAAAEAANQEQAGASTGAFSTPGTAARKMIYQATIMLEVENYKQTQANINQLVARYQGYVLSSSESENEREKEGSITIRIPQNGFSSFVNELDKLATKIPVRNIQGQDVTEEYVDLTSRLKAYQAVETRLLQFMGNAQKTEDLLKISNDLAKVQEEIEKIKGRMRYLDENISFSTITLSIIEKKVTANLNQVADEGTWKKAWLALNKSTLGLLDFFNGLIVLFAGSLPILIVLALIGVPVFFYWRKRVKKVPPTPPSTFE